MRSVDAHAVGLVEAAEPGMGAILLPRNPRNTPNSQEAFCKCLIINNVSVVEAAGVEPFKNSNSNVMMANDFWL
jgi:hypothetical protein